VLNLDHFIARALGGTNEIDNLFTACRECNNRKGRTGPGDIIRRMSAGIRKFGV
jgi:5-methylcytosine-specific restriction endonuclease McrA